MDENSSSNHGWGGIIGTILIIAFLIFAFRGFKNPSDSYSRAVGGFIGIGVRYPSRIMKYSGTEPMMVCKIPYFESSECYYLDVVSNGESFTKILFANGGYIYLNDIECSQLADWYKNDGDNEFFCTGYGQDESEWDIFLPGTSLEIK